MVNTRCKSRSQCCAALDNVANPTLLTLYGDVDLSVAVHWPLHQPTHNCQHCLVAVLGASLRCCLMATVRQLLIPDLPDSKLLPS
jgi:hypothetical protein